MVMCCTGTFGQPDQWDIHNSSTFLHPMVPYDVLIDPVSMPDHPIMQEKHNLDSIIHAESIQNITDQQVLQDTWCHFNIVIKSYVYEYWWIVELSGQQTTYPHQTLHEKSSTTHRWADFWETESQALWKCFRKKVRRVMVVVMCSVICISLFRTKFLQNNSLFCKDIFIDGIMLKFKRHQL